MSLPGVRRLLTLLTGTALAAVAAVTVATPAHAATSCTPNGNQLTMELRDFYAAPGYSYSCGNLRFDYQASDRNVVIYYYKLAVWSTGQNNKPSTLFAVQTDGNVVQYNGSQWIWASGTGGNPNASLVTVVTRASDRLYISVLVRRPNGSVVKYLANYVCC